MLHQGQLKCCLTEAILIQASISRSLKKFSSFGTKSNHWFDQQSIAFKLCSQSHNCFLVGKDRFRIFNRFNNWLFWNFCPGGAVKSSNIGSNFSLACGKAISISFRIEPIEASALKSFCSLWVKTFSLSTLTFQHSALSGKIKTLTKWAKSFVSSYLDWE